MSTDIKYSIGFDLGDAESSIAYIPVNNRFKPLMFELEPGESSIPTAIATARRRNSPTSKILIGSEAFLKDGIQQLDLSFKYRPTTITEADWHSLSHWIQLFAQEFYRRFAIANPEIAQCARIYIGAPSSWSADDIEQCQALFPPPPLGVMPEVEIVSESRSAFIHVRDYYIKAENQQDAVLIIDIGSSTTDFTYVENLEPQEIPIGSEFGARLIDQLLYEQVIEQQPDAITFRKHLDDKDQESAYLLYICRKAKEQYYSKQKKKPHSDSEVFQEIIERCWPFLQDLDMEAILARPINSYPKGWKAGFRELLLQAQTEYLKKYHRQLAPKILLLTGGGSRMSFTREISQEVFNLQEKDISPDPQPFFSVARGLAGFGRWHYRVKQFREAIKEFCQSEGLGKEIQKHSQPFAFAALKFTHKHFIDKVLVPTLLEAREKKIRARDIGEPYQYCRQRFFQWLETPEGQVTLREEVSKVIEPFNSYLVVEANEICERFAMEKGSLQISLEIFVRQMIEQQIDASDIFERYVPRLAIAVGDFVVPKWLRTVVPPKLIQWGGQVGMGLSDGFHDLINMGYDLGHIRKAQFVANVRAQIKKQLEEKAAQVEKLLN